MNEYEQHYVIIMDEVLVVRVLRCVRFSFFFSTYVTLKSTQTAPPGFVGAELGWAGLAANGAFSRHWHVILC